MFLAKIILWCLGWSELNVPYRPRKAVILYPHTSKWDFLIFLLYKLAYPDIFQPTKVFMKPQPFKYFRWILRRWGCLPTTPREQTGGGMVSSIINSLVNESEYLIVISPKGTVENVPWRSGYRAIAQGLNCPFWITGLDYKLKKLRVMTRELPNTTSESELKTHLAQIHPSMPSRCEYSLIDRTEYSPIESFRFSMLISGLLVVPTMFSLGIYIGIVSLLTTIVAIKYHDSQERKHILADRYMVRLMAILYAMKLEFPLQPNLVWSLLILSTLFSYWKARGWYGRKHELPRTPQYELWHPIFHVFFALSIVFPFWKFEYLFSL